jgi:hypothetical protein
MKGGKKRWLDSFFPPKQKEFYQGLYYGFSVPKVKGLVDGPINNFMNIG